MREWKDREEWKFGLVELITFGGIVIIFLSLLFCQIKCGGLCGC